MKNEVAIIIPTYNPDENLIKIINELKYNQYEHILVVNDGSTNSDILKKVKKEVIVINHKINKGKGRSLKTGFKYYLKSKFNIRGAITVDSDGQHKIEDINKIYANTANYKNSIILGTRNFNQPNIPLKSKFGNKLINKIINRNIDFKIKDSQTGLRYIPYNYLPKLLKLKGERYEYETVMLIYCIKKKLPIMQIDIETVYIENNRKTNFKSIRDSLEILKECQKMSKKFNKTLYKK